jgi:hypothetical protein
MQNYKDDCVLCRELSGSKQTNFHAIYGEHLSRKLAETDNFVLIPALGQLMKYQSMIVPKQHFISMKEAIKDFSEIQTLLDFYKNTFLSQEDEVMLFENGNSATLPSSCIEHAHLNLLPIAFDFEKEKAQFLDLTDGIVFHQDLEGLYNDVQYDKTYRMAGTISKGFYSIHLQQKSESQFMRKKISKLLNQEMWDWKTFGFQESVQSLLNFKKEKHVLSTYL